ncbi:MAG TPA: gamma-glutamyl-gamma-aminobutyrate hydrolase family protein [Gemmatimonadaceae bacterium]|nr:gamma-glutamyl-gamma-aminobutyrate hydrolase family protein [Gemmatimonadaceae bacterium]
MPDAPLIGITATTEMSNNAPRIRLNAAYAAAIESAGGVPLVLAPLHSLSSASRMLDAVDALLLTGGEDVDPERYDEPHHEALGTVNAARDATEIELVTAVHARRLPVLAICRGVQLLNVALGGSLIQDIPSQRRGALAHDAGGAHDVRSHDVDVAPASRLAHALGATHLAVNSFHHQAVERIAEGFRLAAWSSDDLVEAIESEDAAWWAVGVQWHPEELTGDQNPWARSLFRTFVQRAIDVRGERRKARV